MDVIQNATSDAVAAVAADSVPSPPHENQTFRSVLMTVILVINYAGLLVVMFSMGCVISIKDFSRKEMHLPQSVMIGLGLQYFIQPLVGYLIAILLDMHMYDALAILLLSSCPVSPYCAVLVFYGEGYVTVGMCLSMFSTALAIGLMPYWFSFYSSTWTDEYYVIGTPFDICLTEMLIFVPALVGVVFKRYAGLQRARQVARICSFAFMITVVVTPVLNAIDHPEHYIADWKLWMGGILLPFIGFVCGFFLSLLFRLPYESCSAVSLAVGTPNWFIATNAAWRFFAADKVALHEVLTLVSIFSISMPVEGFVWSVTFRAIEEFFQKIYPKCCKGDDSGDEGDSDDEEPVEKEKKESVMFILGQVLGDEDVEDLKRESQT